jgi:hypothetical protein
VLLPYWRDVAHHLNPLTSRPFLMKMDFLGEEGGNTRHGHKNRKMVFVEAAYLGPDFTWGETSDMDKRKHKDGVGGGRGSRVLTSHGGALDMEVSAQRWC